MMPRRTLFLLLVICLGHVLLISAQVQSRSGLPLIEAVAFDAYARIQTVTAHVADGGRGLWTDYFALRGAARDNQVLRERILALEGQLQEQQAVSSKTRALEQLLALRERSAVAMLAARVIAGNPSPGVFTVMIDRGREDGVELDMAVIGAEGVVGRVIGPIAPRAALVQLLIDRNAAAAVTFEKSGAGGIVVGGETNPPLTAEYVPASATVVEGERVFTAGQDRVFPAGFLVGTVTRISAPNSPDRQILIRPAVDFSHIDFVLVVLEKMGAGGGT